MLGNSVVVVYGECLSLETLTPHSEHVIPLALPSDKNMASIAAAQQTQEQEEIIGIARLIPRMTSILYGASCASCA